MIKRKGAVHMKARLHFGLALGLACLVGALALLVGNGSVGAVNGFSDNQELPLPLLAPIANSGVSFIVRGLEPSVRVDAQGTVYVSSIRGVPTGVDLHRYYAAVDGPPGAGGTSTRSSTRASPTTAASSTRRKAAAQITTLILSASDWAAAMWILR